MRKTRDRWDIMVNCGYGWEAECCEYTISEAKRTYQEYLDNACGRYSVRLEKHREKICEAEAS